MNANAGRRRLIFAAILTAALYVTLELTSVLGWWVMEGDPFSWDRAHLLRASRLSLAPQAEGGNLPGVAMPEWLQYDVVHPYLGFISTPERVSVTSFGYWDDKSPLQRRAPGRLIVGLLGGSMAASFPELGWSTLRTALASGPPFAGREIVLVNLAQGGYKQPQQLITLNYLLTLGAEFDLIINLDGFNEVALHAAENGRKGVYPVFPRSWYFYASTLPDETLRELLGRRSFVRQRSRRAAEIADARPLRWSAAATLLWRVMDRRDQLAVQQVEAALRNRHIQADVPYGVRGPGYDPARDGEIYDHLTAIWRRASLQMDRLCRANGIRYVHFLQPNQYLPGAKPMLAEERSVAFREDHPYRGGVEAGYPRLAAAGAVLLEAGVEFVDLSRIFEADPDSLYVDDCCHLGHVGNHRMALHMARALLRRSASQEE
jgi:hypothetical protein